MVIVWCPQDIAPVATEEEAHPSQGLPFCTLAELPATIDRMLENDGKTILLLDNSPEQHAASYFSYKAMMEVYTCDKIARRHIDFMNDKFDVGCLQPVHSFR